MEVNEATVKKCEILDYRSSCSGSIEGGSVGGGEIETERKGKNRASIESEFKVQSDHEQTSFISYQIPKPSQAMGSEKATTSSDHVESESRCGLVGSPDQSASWKQDQRERTPPMNVR